MAKKTLFIFFTLLSTLTTSAYDAKINGIYYNFLKKAKLAEVTNLSDIPSENKTAYSGSVNIPESVTYEGVTYSVTSIGNYAFFECTGLTNVRIPSSVTSIGIHAFRGCTNLGSVKIPDSVTTIGKNAFDSCTGLISVVIGNSVTSIDQDTFSSCLKLTSVTIGNSVTRIGHSAFYLCKNLKSITIPNSVKDIHGFSESGLKTVIIGDGVNTINSFTFYNCPELESVTIGSGVKNINSSAFANCPELTNIYIHAEDVPTTETDAFNNSYVEYANLYVPNASMAAYKAKSPWNRFGTVIPIKEEIPICATPSISIVDGKIRFACETEGAGFIYTITPSTTLSGKGEYAPLLTKYTISVYATKEGYEDSEVATKEINLRGDANLDGDINMPDAMFIVNKILNGKFPDEK